MTPPATAMREPGEASATANGATSHVGEVLSTEISEACALFPSGLGGDSAGGGGRQTAESVCTATLKPSVLDAPGGAAEFGLVVIYPLCQDASLTEWGAAEGGSPVKAHLTPEPTGTGWWSVQQLQ